MLDAGPNSSQERDFLVNLHSTRNDVPMVMISGYVDPGAILQRKCLGCRATESAPKQFRRCSRCLVAVYCSRGREPRVRARFAPSVCSLGLAECQAADWPSHKPRCQAVQSSAVAQGSASAASAAAATAAASLGVRAPDPTSPGIAAAPQAARWEASEPPPAAAAASRASGSAVSAPVGAGRDQQASGAKSISPGIR